MVGVDLVQVLHAEVRWAGALGRLLCDHSLGDIRAWGTGQCSQPCSVVPESRGQGFMPSEHPDPDSYGEPAHSPSTVSTLFTFLLRAVAAPLTVIMTFLELKSGFEWSREASNL